jgi:DNA polymerase III sliding clamp (beta) subunit (PCNA family)
LTKVVFETATLQSAINKASRIAPAKGAAFDKAAGIIIEVNPVADVPVIIRATDLDTFYMEWVDCVLAEGDPTIWRVPSKVFAGVMAGLPIGSGREVTLQDVMNDNGYRYLQMTQARSKAKFNLLAAEYYPHWSAFDPDILTVTPDLGGKISLVEWAASKGNDGVLTGVHLDGKRAIATDKYRFATAPLVIEHISDPITIPGTVLTSLLKQKGEVKIAVVDGQLFIMPDLYTQIRTITFGEPYPIVDRIMRRDQPDFVRFRKAVILDMMKQAMNFVGADRNPLLQMYVGREEIAVYLGNRETGGLGDVLDIPTQAVHPRVELRFTPKNIIDAIENAPSEEIVLYYNRTDTRKPVRVDGGSGYEAWVAMRREGSTE